MALSVSNNNGGQPITQDGTYCMIQVPGYVPPDIAGPNGSSPVFGIASYMLTTGKHAKGTLVTFEAQGADGVFRSLSNPAPITCTNQSTFNGSAQGAFGALRLRIDSAQGEGLTYAQLSGTPAGILHPPPTPEPGLFKAEHVTTQLSIDPEGGDLIATALEGPNAGKAVNLTYGKWTPTQKSR